MQNVAFVTSTSHPEITVDDQLIVNHLLDYNIRVEPAPWDSPKTNWNNYSAIVFRSCWNYHQKAAAFELWLEKMKPLGLPFLNSLNVVTWNLHKKYLFDLESLGIAIPPAVLIAKNERVLLNDIMENKGWAKIVAKPVISANAKDTWVASKEDLSDAQLKFDDSISRGAMIIQKFMNEVTEHGEVSMIFINKKYVHSIIKKPKLGDFRVQSDYGGKSDLFFPPAEIIAFGEKIVGTVNDRLLFARVDGVISNNQFLLMELELIEPVLFLKQYPLAAKLLAQEINSFICKRETVPR